MIKPSQLITTRPRLLQLSLHASQKPGSLFVLIHTGEAVDLVSSPPSPTSRLTSRAEVNECAVSVISAGPSADDQGQRHGRCRGLSGAADAAGVRWKQSTASIGSFIYFFVIFVPVRRRSSLLAPSPAFLTSRRAGERCGLFNY